MDKPPSPPTRSLAGKVAIVTGAGAAGRGIGNGRASAILLAQDGCSVVCADKDVDSAQTTVDMIASSSFSSPSSSATGAPPLPSPGRAIAVRADVTSAADCAALVATAVSTFGRLDILLNCVGIGGTMGTAPDLDMEAWARDMQTNVTSMVLMAKHAVPAMLKNPLPSDARVTITHADSTTGAGPSSSSSTTLPTSSAYRGSIVNLSSIAGLCGGTPSLLYPTSKGAIVNMTRAMAAHHGGAGIRVNCVCPGMVYTPMVYAGGMMSSAARTARSQRNLLQTEGNGWDVGAAMRWLAGDEARWVTGHALVVDAGATAGIGAGMQWGATAGGFTVGEDAGKEGGMQKAKL